MQNPYAPDFTGLKSNIFVVDTGIDEKHVEFASTYRVVSNLYTAFQQSPEDGGITDDVGHGTHCAGE